MALAALACAFSNQPPPEQSLMQRRLRYRQLSAISSVSRLSQRSPRSSDPTTFGYTRHASKAAGRGMTDHAPAGTRPHTAVTTGDATGKFRFSVDSALLKELGERLVGRPAIALAELVKNAYDADATRVLIGVSQDKLEVRDNGVGMDRNAFQSYWMRIGSPHRQQERSTRLGRALTGSKGVGRLAAQFLGRRIEVRTVAEHTPDLELRAWVDWDAAVQAGDLTRATAEFRQSSAEAIFPDSSRHGTVVTIQALNQVWTSQLFEDLAREIWTLQSPLPPSGPLRAVDFQVDLETADPSSRHAFLGQMAAVLDLWSARIRAHLLPLQEGELGTERWPTRVCEVQLEFRDGETHSVTFDIPDCAIDTAEVEIRVFDFLHRQPRGIKVDAAREYVRRFGGVHVYDAGFNLPYYGGDTDWLNIERDHANRLSRSDLLPAELQVREGLNDLPTNRRIFGAVYVDTSHERRAAQVRLGESAVRDCLQIQVSRDRLVDNSALANLRFIARWPLDYYATRQSARKLRDVERQRPTESLDKKGQRLLDVLDQRREQMDVTTYRRIRTVAEDVLRSTAVQQEIVRRQAGVLGALATAGITALASEHEVSKQLALLEDAARQLVDTAAPGSASENIASQINEWIKRARATRALFGHLLQLEDTEVVARFNARHVVGDVARSVAPLMRGATIDTRPIDGSLRLPPARLAEWSAIFQNVLINAANAMLDRRVKEVRVRSAAHGKSKEIRVEDTGYGIDLSQAEQFFEPFERGTPIPADRQALGAGGMGLGLTIVRMVATAINCEVGFAEPSEGFSTSFRLAWREP